MWSTVERILSNQSPWSPAFYLVAGAVLGAMISAYLALKSQRPRLVIVGGGSGGNQQEHHWRVSVGNRPSFLGVPLDGESARDVSAFLRLKEKGAQGYPVYWSGASTIHNITIDPGQANSLELFHWKASGKGYYVVDNIGDPVARFDSRELRFVLRLSDRLGRATEFPFRVLFDDTNLKNTPRLQIRHPLSFGARVTRLRSGLQGIASAFRDG